MVENELEIQGNEEEYMKRVAILSGGWSEERDVSLQSGRAVFNALKKKGYEVRIFDPRTELIDFIEERDQTDIVFNLLHGRYGEDGSIQGMLNTLGLPFVGSDLLSSAISFNKRLSKEILEAKGLLVPRGTVLRRGDSFSVESITKSIGRTTVVKPVSQGSSVGISICKTDAELTKGIENAFEFDREILIEEYIDGTEITVCVLGNSMLEALPVVEIIPNEKHLFFDYNAKYNKGETEDICPASIPGVLSSRAQDIAKEAHRALMCRVWSRTDMIIREHHIYILETNTIPGMTETSLFPLAAKVHGLSFPDLVHTLITLSLQDPPTRG